MSTATGLAAGTTYHYRFYIETMDGCISYGPDGCFTTNSVRLDGACSYSGTRPSSVGIYLGTSSSFMTKWDSDTINHNKIPISKPYSEFLRPQLQVEFDFKKTTCHSWTSRGIIAIMDKKRRSGKYV